MARHAIWNACQALGLKEGDVVLVPAYHHGSEIEALLKAGLHIKYYELNDMLEPDETELEKLLTSDVRALYLTHYLGFTQDAAYWRNWCDKRGLLLIEDAAQAFLATRDGQPVGSFGHMGVFCLYKTYGIPDGAAVVANVAIPTPSSAPKSGFVSMAKKHYNWVAERLSIFGHVKWFVDPILTWWRLKTDRPDEDFALDDPLLPPSNMSSRLLPAMLDEKTAEIRRANYQYLLQHLGDLVPLPFRTLRGGESPFAFPIEAENPRGFLKSLRKRGIEGLLFWFFPHPSLPVEDFPKSKLRRDHILAVPVHQELTKAHLEHIVDAVLETQSKLAKSTVAAS
jgi:dTDP-4-amino-4,6-dideoxygalactose transaminase